MEQTTEQIFEEHFTRWAEQMMPKGTDTTALRAIAWFWFTHGNDHAVLSVRYSFREFEHKQIASKLVTESARFQNGL